MSQTTIRAQIVKISLVLTCTNPKSQKYLTFFATIRSWYKYVDEILIVDGGTTDDSFEQLSHEELRKCKFISNKCTKWDITQGFSPNHINSMINEGLRYSTGDWTFIIGADFVLDHMDRVALESELKMVESHFWVRFPRRKAKIYNKDDWNYEFDHRGTVVLNMNLVKKMKQFPYMMGLLKGNNIIYDYPILATDYSKVSHNATGPVVIPRGELLGGGNYVLKSAQVFVSDHFFYDYELAFKQRHLFFEYFNARMTASCLLSDAEIRQKIGKSQVAIPKNYFSRLDAPKDFLDLIKECYQETILGGFYDLKPGIFNLIVFKNRIIRKLRSTFLRFRGLKKIGNQIHWADSYDDVEITDLNSLYDNQERFIK